MTEQEIYKIIVETISEILDDKGLDVPEITPETEILGDDLGTRVLGRVACKVGPGPGRNITDVKRPMACTKF